MSSARTRSAPRSPRRRRILHHRMLMAVEAVLVIGLLKDVLEDLVKASALPNWGKVLFVMAGTVGLLGGLYWLIELLTQRGVESAHTALRSFLLPRLVVHLAVFGFLFFAYAKYMRVAIF